MDRNNEIGPALKAGPFFVDHLASTLQELLAAGPDGPPILVLHHGSRRLGRDIDLLVAYEHEPRRNEVLFGRIDAFCVSLREVRDWLSHLDPIVTEPLLGGTLVLGKRGVLDELIGDARAIEPTAETVRHHRLRALQCYYRANEMMRAAVDGNASYDMILNMSYALSYSCFARYYGNPHAKLITFSALMGQMNAPISGIWSEILALKSAQQPQLIQLREIMSAYEGAILNVP